MNLNVEKEVAALRRMSVGQLRQRYAEVFGEPTRSRHKPVSYTHLTLPTIYSV